MNAYDGLPDAVTEVFGEEATAERAYDLLTVDVPPASWIAALTTARDELGCTYFDWLSAVDEPGTGFRVCAHVVSLGGGRPRRLLLRTTVPHSAPVLPTAVEVYAGAGWHERETHEMFGVDFTGHPNPAPLLLPENFEGHPLRKDFVLAARVAKAWPGAKEPGESHDGGGPKRRQMLPPGVPDPNEWGPLKGQLPPAPTRAERPARRTRTTTEATPPDPTTTPPVRRARSASEGSASQEGAAAPVRRTRSASDGSASQAGDGAGDATADTPPEAPRPPRRSRSASDGSASQATGEPGAPVRRSRSASDGSASQAAAPDAAARPPRRSRSAADGSASQTPQEPTAPRHTRSTDAPWHHARPAFDEDPAEPEIRTEPAAPAEPATPETPAEPDTATEPAEPTEPDTATEPTEPTEPDTATEPAEPDTAPAPAAPAEPDTAPGPDTAPRPGTAPGPAAPAEPDTVPAPPATRAPGAAAPGEEKPADPDTGTDPDPTHPAGGDPA
ncbi:NADH-quinone oxidoreductase subunit C [Streptomyces sp. NPDC057235]|uniref:NADH-quinone oxidoreductase subunit C n=1 Tax=Streptomyces sp. NPDC057235 TaxID=3346058 RepID=UPI00362DAE7D